MEQKLQYALKGMRKKARPANQALRKLGKDDVTESEKQGSLNNQKEVIVTIITSERVAREPEESLRVLNVHLLATLIAKAESGAKKKLDGCTRGEGLRAYVGSHAWLTRTTDHGRSKRRAAIMNPHHHFHAHDIYAAVERWEESTDPSKRMIEAWNSQTDGRWQHSG